MRSHSRVVDLDRRVRSEGMGLEVEEEKSRLD